MAAPPELPELIDRKGLLAMGLGEEDVERVRLALPTVAFGGRKWYVRRADVAAYLEQHTREPMRGAA